MKMRLEVKRFRSNGQERRYCLKDIEYDLLQKNGRSIPDTNTELPQINLSHIIGNKRSRSDVFISQSTFQDYSISISLPRLSESNICEIFGAMDNYKIPSLSERRQIIETLSDYRPRDVSLESIVKITGMPVKWVSDMIEEGKNIALRIAKLDSDQSNKKVYVGIPPNDPREPFYFVAHLLLAGTPSIIKPSSREPVLTYDIIEYLNHRGMPKGMINLIYADTNDVGESQLLTNLMRSVDLPIVMGSTKVTENQVSFSADCSRGLVIGSKGLQAVTPNIIHSIMAPNACIAEHNYVVVGSKDEIQVFAEKLASVYDNLKSGDLMDYSTTRGLIQQDVLEYGVRLLREGQVMDTAGYWFAGNNEPINNLFDRWYNCNVETNPQSINVEKVIDGVIAVHDSEDYKVSSNPLMVRPLPLYITGVRGVDNLEQAIKDLEIAKIGVDEHVGTKSMALGIYGDIDPQGKYFERLKNVAYDVSINSSPMLADGIVHQGIDLNKELTK